jgi:putative hemolysin
MVAVEIGTLVLLTLLNGAFAMSELAVVSSRPARLRAMAEDGSRGARTALRLAEDPGRFLSTVQIGITLVGVVAGAFGGATLGARFGAWLDGIPALGGRGEVVGVAAVLVAITFMSIVLGELIPKRVALRDPERTAAVVAGPMLLLSRIAAPFVWLLGTTTDLVLRALRLHGAREAAVTEEEVRSLIAEGEKAGVFEPQERSMIDGVMRLADRSVRSIMTPRPDVVWLDAGEAPDRVAERIRAAGHSRYPVCRGGLEDLVGIVHARDLLEAALRGEPLDLAARALPPLAVHDGAPVLRLLELFKSTGAHLAVVVDEYGSVEGVVSVADIVESIAGDLPEAGEAPEVAAVRRADGSWLVEGWMPLDEFEHTVGAKGLRGGDGYHTVAGLVLDALGRIPAAGDAFERGGLRFEIVDMDGRRIDKILVQPPAPPGTT